MRTTFTLDCYKVIFNFNEYHFLIFTIKKFSNDKNTTIITTRNNKPFEYFFNFKN